jgi:hypothetical protein
MHFQFEGGIEVNTTIDPNNEELEHAVVQCLRLFAQLGRKIRNENLLSERIPMDNPNVEEDANGSNNQESQLKVI